MIVNVVPLLYGVIYGSPLTEIIKIGIRGIITDWELCDQKWWDLRITIEVSGSASDQYQVQC